MARAIDNSVHQFSSEHKSNDSKQRYDDPNEFDAALERVAFNLLLWADAAEAARDYGAAVGDIDDAEWDHYDAEVTLYRAAAAKLYKVIHFNG
jgi:hypothetical protein